MYSKLNLSILGWKASSEMCDVLTAEPGGRGRAMAPLIKEQPGAFTSASEGAGMDCGAQNLRVPADGCI